MPTRNNEIIRGKILNCLALIYPQAATLPLLQGELRIFGHCVPMDEVEAHLDYLVVKEMISREKYRIAHQRKKYAPMCKVTLVKITAKGLDYYDGRLPADPGIYVEPK